MPSCSTSSNIISSINALNVTLGGSRLTVAIDYLAGLTLGDVIRYDVVSSGYTGSRADTPVNAEVFGVIENYDSTTNKFNVVIYGSINIDSSKLLSVGVLRFQVAAGLGIKVQALELGDGPVS